MQRFGELYRGYWLAKARQIEDDFIAIDQAPARAGATTAEQAQQAEEEAAPEYLRSRVVKGQVLPSVEVLRGMDDDSHRGAWRNRQTARRRSSGAYYCARVYQRATALIRHTVSKVRLAVSIVACPARVLSVILTVCSICLFLRLVLAVSALGGGGTRRRRARRQRGGERCCSM
jgi:hypothetical protein